MQRRKLERARRLTAALDWLWYIVIIAALTLLTLAFVRHRIAEKPLFAAVSEEAAPTDDPQPIAEFAEDSPVLLSETPISIGTFEVKSESSDASGEVTPDGAEPVFLSEISPVQLARADAATKSDVDPEELDLLARLIYAEAGSSWIPDEIQLAVGSVVLNRVASPYFPDTLRDVIYAPKQYGCAMTGAIEREADERTIENARTLLTSGSVLPSNVVFQAEFKQGDGVYMTYEDEILGTTTYFCTYGEEDVIK